MRIDQFVHTLNYGDAISNEAVTLKRLLRSQAVESEIYSVHAHEKVAHDRLALNRFPQIDAGNRPATKQDGAILLHYSIASPLNALYLAQSNRYRILLYHNLTPEHFFQPYNARVCQDLERAREDLIRTAEVTDLILADSEFNRSELSRFGIKDAQLFPLVFDQKKWEVPANSGIASILRKHGGKNILHVGRMAPNKCIEDIIRTFYCYFHKIDRKSRLWLVGSDVDTEIYSFEMRKLVRDLRLDQAVHFAGAVADSELRAFYEGSDCYLAMSEHEGFCVPLLEAMSFGVPVIAYSSSAVPETVGDAGLLITQKDPSRVAELLDLALHDTALRADLRSKGRKRASAFGMEAFELRVRTQILQPLAKMAEASLDSQNQSEGVSRASNRT